MCDAFGWCDFLSLTSITANSSVKSDISELLKFICFVVFFLLCCHIYFRKKHLCFTSFHTFFMFSSHFLHVSSRILPVRLLAPRTQLRVGLATATSSLFLGETEAPTKRKKRFKRKKNEFKKNQVEKKHAVEVCFEVEKRVR